MPVSYTHLGAREIGFLFGQYKRIRGVYEGVLTGKGLTYGGSLARTEATGYGLIYLLDEMLKQNGKELAGKTVVVSGSGNVAIYATQKATQLGAKVVALSDSNGWIYDANGINLDVVRAVSYTHLIRYSRMSTGLTEPGFVRFWFSRFIRKKKFKSF